VLEEGTETRTWGTQTQGRKNQPEPTLLGNQMRHQQGIADM
jgi:hypothetical protein